MTHHPHPEGLLPCPFQCCGCGFPYRGTVKQCHCATNIASRGSEYIANEGPGTLVHETAEAIFNALPEDVRRHLVTEQESDFYPVARAAIAAYVGVA